MNELQEKVWQYCVSSGSAIRLYALRLLVERNFFVTGTSDETSLRLLNEFFVWLESIPEFCDAGVDRAREALLPKNKWRIVVDVEILGDAVDKFDPQNGTTPRSSSRVARALRGLVLHEGGRETESRRSIGNVTHVKWERR